MQAWGGSPRTVPVNKWGLLGRSVSRFQWLNRDSSLLFRLCILWSFVLISSAICFFIFNYYCSQSVKSFNTHLCQILSDCEEEKQPDVAQPEKSGWTFFVCSWKSGAHHVSLFFSRIDPLFLLGYYYCYQLLLLLLLLLCGCCNKNTKALTGKITMMWNNFNQK